MLKPTMLAAPVPESYGDQFVSYLHAMLVYVSTGDLIGRLKQAPGYKKGQTEQQVKKAANDKKGTGYKDTV